MTPRWTAAPCPLPTRWTPDIDPACVHPEHPRPQSVRPTWHCLNGVYDAAIRPAAEGRPARFDERILVPFPVESSLSGLGRELTPADRLWYRRASRGPAAASSSAPLPAARGVRSPKP